MSIPWKAGEGRLRLLVTDGGTLVDVMSPSVTLDGKRVLFAGRKAGPDAGRCRIDRVDIDGGNLKPLTGGSDDAGSGAVPPLRFAAADGTTMSVDARRRLDSDDVDPADLGPNGFAFASSRVPDLGRDHARRSTQIWTWPGGAAPAPLSANRNKYRRPTLIAGDIILISLWSRTREAVTADRADVRPASEGGESSTAPSDRWMAARFMTNGATFGSAVESVEPVWRPRPLFDGRVAFMTATPAGPGRLRLAQADGAPSSRHRLRRDPGPTYPSR